MLNTFSALTRTRLFGLKRHFTRLGIALPSRQAYRPAVFTQILKDNMIVRCLKFSYKASAPAADARTSESISSKSWINLGTTFFWSAWTFPRSLTLQEYKKTSIRPYNNLSIAWALLCLIVGSSWIRSLLKTHIPSASKPSSGLIARQLFNVSSIMICVPFKWE